MKRTPPSVRPLQLTVELDDGERVIPLVTRTLPVPEVWRNRPLRVTLALRIRRQHEAMSGVRRGMVYNWTRKQWSYLPKMIRSPRAAVWRGRIGPEHVSPNDRWVRLRISFSSSEPTSLDIGVDVSVAPPRRGGAHGATFI